MAEQSDYELSARLMNNSIENSRHIEDYNIKNSVMAKISHELAKQGNFQKALDIIQEINSETLIRNALVSVIIEKAKKGDFSGAIETLSHIHESSQKNESLGGIAIEFAKIGQLNIALNHINKITSSWYRSDSIRTICLELIKQCKYEQAIETSNILKYDLRYFELIQNIILEIIQHSRFKEGSNMLQMSLTPLRGGSDSVKNLLLRYIIVDLANHVSTDESIFYLKYIKDDKYNLIVLSEVIKILFQHGETKQSIKLARDINDLTYKSEMLAYISTGLNIQGEDEDSDRLIKEALAWACNIKDQWDRSLTLVEIASELSKQGKYEEALECLKDIDQDLIIDGLNEITEGLAKRVDLDNAIHCVAKMNNDWRAGEALRHISTCYSRLGSIEDALMIARSIESEWERGLALLDLSIELLNQCDEINSASVVQEAIETVSIKVGTSYVQSKIATVLAKYGKIKEALDCANFIKDEREKNRAKQGITIELARQGNWTLAEEVVSEIPLAATRHGCWKQMAAALVEKDGWKVALDKVRELQADEARLFYLKGWAERVNVTDVDAQCLYQALPLLAGDSTSLEHLLQHYAIHEIFLGQSNRESMDRLNKTLNVQWAIDIQSSFANEANDKRHLSNLETWIHEIEDEDDRDQIELWAKQVAKGKINEEQFLQNVKGMG
jgi:tetratricopeptide (TPR) repeat protein